jgi:hypothetical protein
LVLGGSSHVEHVLKDITPGGQNGFVAREGFVSTNDLDITEFAACKQFHRILIQVHGQGPDFIMIRIRHFCINLKLRKIQRRRTRRNPEAGRTFWYRKSRFDRFFDNQRYQIFVIKSASRRLGKLSKRATFPRRGAGVAKQEEGVKNRSRAMFQRSGSIEKPFHYFSFHATRS